MSRRKQLLLVAAVLVGAILIAVLMVTLRPETEEQERVEQAPLVETVAFEQDTGPLEVRGSGTVQASETVTVGAEVGGRLVVIERVPARVSRTTGERLYAPETVERIQAIIWGQSPPARTISAPVYVFSGQTT